MPTLKLMCIGDAASGKSCLIKRFVDNTFSENYNATYFDEYTKDLVFDDETYTLKIHDTGG
jgi:small GTP-binding protein